MRRGWLPGCAASCPRRKSRTCCCRRSWRSGEAREATVPATRARRPTGCGGSLAGRPNHEAWRLMYVEDRPVAEVAELTGVPWGTVKSRAYRGGQQLRAALRRRELAREGGER